MKLICVLLATIAWISTALPVPAATLQSGPEQLQTIESLTGTWDYHGKMMGGTLTDVFRPFGNGTAILGEEWVDGKQITSTIFYVVAGQLYADHYCDYKNQPRFTALPSTNPNIVDFEFRDATNIDTNPIFFHSTVWTIVDSDHLVQDWYVQGGKTPNALVHMTFTKRKA
jgi:hypothetical protein